jgi:hypothetical protein
LRTVLEAVSGVVGGYPVIVLWHVISPDKVSTGVSAT